MKRALLAALALPLLLSGCSPGTRVELSSDASPSPPGPTSTAGEAPDAAGVDDGTKRQASGVRMHSIAPGIAALDPYGAYGGCTPGYGRGKACLPPVSPAAAAMAMTAAQMPWTCDDVRALLPDGILLDTPGNDPLGLDRDHDGRACGPRD